MPPAFGPGVVLGEEALDGGRALTPAATAAAEGGGDPADVCGADELPAPAEAPDERGGAEACRDGSDWTPPLACAPGPIAASCWPPSFLRSPPPVIDPADGGGCEDDPLLPRAW